MAVVYYQCRWLSCSVWKGFFQSFFPVFLGSRDQQRRWVSYSVPNVFFQFLFYCFLDSRWSSVSEALMLSAKVFNSIFSPCFSGLIGCSVSRFCFVTSLRCEIKKKHHKRLIIIFTLTNSRRRLRHEIKRQRKSLFFLRKKQRKRQRKKLIHIHTRPNVFLVCS